MEQFNADHWFSTIGKKLQKTLPNWNTYTNEQKLHAIRNPSAEFIAIDKKNRQDSILKT